MTEDEVKDGMTVVRVKADGKPRPGLCAVVRSLGKMVWLRSLDGIPCPEGWVNVKTLREVRKEPEG